MGEERHINSRKSGYFTEEARILRGWRHTSRTHGFLENHLQQTVPISNHVLNLRSVTATALRGDILEPLLFKIYTNDIASISHGPTFAIDADWYWLVWFTSDSTLKLA